MTESRYPSERKYPSRDYASADNWLRYGLDRLVDRDILDEILRSRANTLLDNINYLQHQIKERHELKEQVSGDIESEKRRLRRSFEDMGYIGGWNEAMARRTTLDRKLADLELERLKEEVNCWRDLAMLEKELRYFKEKYKAEKEKFKLF